MTIFMVAIKWRVRLDSSQTEGTIVVNRNQRDGYASTAPNQVLVHPWRASFVEIGHPKRIFGCRRTTVRETVRLLLDKISDRLAVGERERVLTLALQHDLPGAWTPSEASR